MANGGLIFQRYVRVRALHTDQRNCVAPAHIGVVHESRCAAAHVRFHMNTTRRFCGPEVIATARLDVLSGSVCARVVKRGTRTKCASATSWPG